MLPSKPLSTSYTEATATLENQSGIWLSRVFSFLFVLFHSVLFCGIQFCCLFVCSVCTFQHSTRAIRVNFDCSVNWLKLFVSKMAKQHRKINFRFFSHIKVQERFFYPLSPALSLFLFFSFGTSTGQELCISYGIN